MEQWETEIIQTVKECFKPRFTGSIGEWAALHVDLQSGFSIKGKFKPELSPQFNKIFEAIQNPTVREVNILASPRSGKTMVAEISLMHSIAHNSGDVLWLNLSEEKAGQVSDVRMMPMIELCGPVKELLDTDKKYNLNNKRYSFLHSTIHITSPKDNTFNSLGYKFIYFDECWKADKGIIKEAKKRADDYQGVSKCLFFSQGGTKESGWCEQFQTGEQWVYGFRCPHCQALQPFEFSRKREDGTRAGICWPDTLKDTYGRWIINQCANQCWLECFHCKGHINDEPLTRRQLLVQGDWIKTADGNHSNTVKSFRFTNLCNPKMPFSELVIRFLDATYKDDTLDLEKFVTQDTADFWDSTPKRDRVELTLAEYDPSQPFGDFREQRFMAIDCQQSEPHFYYGIVSVNESGVIRAIKYGKCNTWAELDAIQKTYKVEFRQVGVDTGDGVSTETIRSEIVKHGRYYNINGEIWGSFLSLKGSGVPEFKHKSEGGKIYRYSEPEQHYVANTDTTGEEKFLTHVTFASNRYSQILEAMRDGKSQQVLEFAEVTDELTTHLNAEVYMLDPKTNKWGYKCKPNTPNHFWDVFKMLLVMCDLYGCLGISTEETKTV